MEKTPKVVFPSSSNAPFPELDEQEVDPRISKFSSKEEVSSASEKSSQSDDIGIIDGFITPDNLTFNGDSSGPNVFLSENPDKIWGRLRSMFQENLVGNVTSCFGAETAAILDKLLE